MIGINLLLEILKLLMLDGFNCKGCHTMPLNVTMRTDIEFYSRYYHDGKSVEQVLAGDLPSIG